MKKCRKWLLFLTLLISVLLTGCGEEEIEEEVTNAVTNVANATNEYVLGVKGGTNPNYPNVTYEQAFEYFFGDTTWSYFNGSQEGPDEDGDGEPDYKMENVDVVEFTGHCMYSSVEVKALIQFVVEGETFKAVYLSFNDVPQNTLMLNTLISEAFESYIESVSTEEAVIESQDEVVDLEIEEDTTSADEFDEEEWYEEEYEEFTGEEEVNDCINFTQVGLYDHSEYEYLDEYVPRIFLYNDGTFDFVCNYYEEMITWTGWWVLEEEVPMTYHCHVDNCPTLPNLDFYLFHNEARCDAEFYSDYDEFGMTSVEDVLFHVGKDIFFYQ